MLGFKRFDHAATTLAGIELVHQIKKNNSMSQHSALLRHTHHS